MPNIKHISVNGTSYDIRDDVLRGMAFVPEVVVTAENGSAVTAVCGDKTATGTSNGTCTLTLPKFGTWTITVTKGSDTASETLFVDRIKQYEMEISFGPTASATPKGGVTYTNGLSGLDAATLNLYAGAISNNTAITKDTAEVYIDNRGDFRKLSIADEITWVINGVNYVFNIIGFNHDDLSTTTAYGPATKTGKAGITFQMKDCFATMYAMNSSNTNSGGWGSCNLRSTLQGTLKNQLPSDIQPVIKSVSKKTSAGSKSSTINTTSDTVFLLSEVEVYGSVSYSFTGEGDQYGFYASGNSARKLLNGAYSFWWLRSPSSRNTTYFCIVHSDGASYEGDANSTSRKVSFAFCV